MKPLIQIIAKAFFWSLALNFHSDRGSILLVVCDSMCQWHGTQTYRTRILHFCSRCIVVVGVFLRLLLVGV